MIMNVIATIGYYFSYQAKWFSSHSCNLFVESKWFKKSILIENRFIALYRQVFSEFEIESTLNGG